MLGKIEPIRSIEANKALVRRDFEDTPSNPAAGDEILAPGVRFQAMGSCVVRDIRVICVPGQRGP